MSAVVGLLLVFVLPAIAGAVLLSDAPGAAGAGIERDARTARCDLVLARGVAVGIGTWLLGSGLLTRTVGLTATSAWVYEGVVALGSVVLLLLPRQRGRLGVMLRRGARRVGAVVGLTALLYLPLGLVVVRTDWAPIGSTSWYYYGLARQVADLGSIPATSVEFATSTPFLNDYHLFTTGTAMLLVQHPGGPVTVLTLVTLLSVLLLGIGAVTLSSAFGAGRLASLMAVPFAVATGIGIVRLTTYRPEGFALGLVLLVAALAVDWFRRGDRRSLGAAALLAATLSQVHGIAAVSAGVMVTAVALALLTRGSWRVQLRRTGIALAVLLAAVVLAGLVFHETSGTTHAGGLVDQGGLDDPTWEFYEAARGHAPSMPPSNGSMLRETLPTLYAGSWWWVVPALVLALLGLWLRRRDVTARHVVCFTVLTLLGLALVASVFMLGWAGYVPRRTGASRIPLQASLVVPTLLAVGLGCLARQAWTWRGRTLRSPALVLLVVLSVTALVSTVQVARFYDGGSIGRHELAVWQDLPLTSSDVVLANGYTEGFIPSATPAQGLLDGRAPYTFDGLLHRANGLLRGAEAFYADPEQHWDYLAQHGVTWVVVGNPRTYALATGNIWYVPSDPDALARCSGLQRVVDDPSLTVYRVVDASPTGCAPTG